VRTSEWVIVAYFAYLLATGASLRVPARRIRLAAALGVLTSALITFVAQFELSPVASALRDWLPGGYLLVGYWTTGVLYRGPNAALEARLDSIDARLFDRLGPLILRVPRVVLEFLEFAYLLCYPLVPAGLGVLYLSGQRARADAYWTLVLVSAFAAYGVLPWAGTRPPRALGCSPWIARWPVTMRRVNLRVLERGSIHVNTFPSGHTASAWAVALFLMTAPGAAWPVFTVLAAAIAVAAVVGRYHYAVDVAAGILVALVAFVVWRL
jgi:membrane-associated phospholipid phosphatase